MVACFCCLKKRGEVYLLRNARGIENHRNQHLRNSDENIPENSAERGEAQRGGAEIQEYQYENEYQREEDRRMFAGLEPWAAEQVELHNRNISGVHTPHAQNLANTQVENEML